MEVTTPQIEEMQFLFPGNIFKSAPLSWLVLFQQSFIEVFMKTILLFIFFRWRTSREQTGVRGEFSRRRGDFARRTFQRRFVAQKADETIEVANGGADEQVDAGKRSDKRVSHVQLASQLRS